MNTQEQATKPRAWDAYDYIDRGIRPPDGGFHDLAPVTGKEKEKNYE